MKVLKHTLFAVALTIGIAVTASAQSNNDGQKKPPPKPPPPVVKVPDKPPPKPRDEKKGDGKKPGMAFLVWKETEGQLV